MSLAVGGNMAANGASKITQEIPLTSLHCTKENNSGIEGAYHNSMRLEVEEDFTFCCWFKLTDDASSVSNEDGIIFSCGASGKGGFVIKYTDDAGDDEYLSITHYHDVGTSTTFVGTGDLDHDIWYHLVYTYRRSAEIGFVYIDGVETREESSLTGPDVTETTYYVGKAVGIGSSTMIDMDINSVGLWGDKYVTAAEVLELYNGGDICDIAKFFPDNQKLILLLDAKDATGSDNIINYAQSAAQMFTAGSALADSDFDTVGVSKNIAIDLR